MKRCGITVSLDVPFDFEVYLSIEINVGIDCRTEACYAYGRTICFYQNSTLFRTLETSSQGSKNSQSE